MKFLEHCFQMPDEVRKLLLSVSPSTIDRILKADKKKLVLPGVNTPSHKSDPEQFTFIIPLKWFLQELIIIINITFYFLFKVTYAFKACPFIQKVSCYNTKPTFYLIKPGAMFGCVYKHYFVSPVRQKCSPGFHIFKNAEFFFTPKVFASIFSILATILTKLSDTWVFKLSIIKMCLSSGCSEITDAIWVKKSSSVRLGCIIGLTISPVATFLDAISPVVP